MADSTEILINMLDKLLEQKNFSSIKAVMATLQPADIATVLEDVPDGKRTVVAEETVRAHEWRPIRADLRKWADTNVRLVLIADCGPKDNTCGDWAAWGDCRLSAE